MFHAQVPEITHKFIEIRGHWCKWQLLYRNRLIADDAGIVHAALFHHTLEKGELRKNIPEKIVMAIAYYDLVHNNTITDKNLLSAIAHNIIIRYPCLIRLSATLEEAAISVYTKDEVLLSVYGEVFGDNLSFQQRRRRKTCGTAADSKTLTFQGRTFVHSSVHKKVGYIWYETTRNRVQIDNMPLYEAQKLEKTAKGTVATMLSLSRLQPCTTHCFVCRELHNLV
jgi:hypothetical protein